MFCSIRVLHARLHRAFSLSRPESFSVEVSVSRDRAHVMQGSSHQDSFSCRRMEKGGVDRIAWTPRYARTLQSRNRTNTLENTAESDNHSQW